MNRKSQDQPANRSPGANPLPTYEHGLQHAIDELTAPKPPLAGLETDQAGAGGPGSQPFSTPTPGYVTEEQHRNALGELRHQTRIWQDGMQRMLSEQRRRAELWKAGCCFLLFVLFIVWLLYTFPSSSSPPAVSIEP